MPYATSEPVALVQANRWSIGDISIDPVQPALNYVVIAFDGTTTARSSTPWPRSQVSPLTISTR